MPQGDGSTGRMMLSVDQLRVEAIHLLSDPAAVETALSEASRRAALDPALAKHYDPLHRLVAGHVSGAYDKADDEDVAWALAAVLYVASAWDLTPDYLPRGLDDDRQVTERVAERIKRTLVAFGLWERVEAKRRRARRTS